MRQASFLSLVHSKKLRCERFLDEMEKVLLWDVILGTMEEHYKGEGGKEKPLLLLYLIFIKNWS